jgi:CubicO group peptidase (beta-lactamase class C family)
LFGRQGPESDAPPIRSDALFLLASITKPIVYLTALKLVERGLLNLNDHVTRYLPEFAAHHKEDTRVLHLFTHTSGLPDMLENNVELRKAHAPLSKFIEGAIRDTLPLFPPGTKVSYQSMGTLVVAQLVQQLTGKSIAQAVRDEILEPLGLKSTNLGSQGLDRARIARILTPNFQTGGTDYDWNSRYWHEFGAPWGGMFSTPEDFAVICQMLLNRGRWGNQQLFSPITIERATTNRLNDLPELDEMWRRTEGWGLGWSLNHAAQGESWGDLLGDRVFGHTGATGTIVWIDPDRDGFCILFTTAPRADAPWRLVHLSNAVSAAFM